MITLSRECSLRKALPKQSMTEVALDIGGNERVMSGPQIQGSDDLEGWTWYHTKALVGEKQEFMRREPGSQGHRK